MEKEYVLTYANQENSEIKHQVPIDGAFLLVQMEHLLKMIRCVDA